jgi:CheY-like chemotaxis protein
MSTSHRVLIVDDNVDAAMLLAELLERRGHQTFVAHDGPEALKLALANVLEVAVIDIGLPGIDGYELAVQLRAALGAKTPRMLAVTGYGADHDRAKSAAAGFAEHLTKPVDSATLVRLFDTPA